LLTRRVLADLNRSFGKLLSKRREPAIGQKMAAEQVLSLHGTSNTRRGVVRRGREEGGGRREEGGGRREGGGTRIGVCGGRAKDEGERRKFCGAVTCLSQTANCPAGLTLSRTAC
jgi:hypothetical protein